MAQRTYKDIEAEANKRFGKGASKEKFEFRRAQQEAAGLERETKKRGGVAGAYDRNKALVQAAAPILAGMLIPGIGSAAAGALTGGLARGLDRPGKGGIGLDLGAAARGAVTGAGLGQLGGAAKAGLQGLMTGGGQAALKPMPAPGAAVETVGQRAAGAIAPPTTAAMPTPTPVPAAVRAAPVGGAGRVASAAARAPMAPMPSMGAGATSVAARAPQAISAPSVVGGMPAPTPVPPAQPGMMSGLLSGAGQKAASIGSGLLDFAKKNPGIVQGVTGGVADVIGSSMTAGAANRRVELEEQELRRRQEEANRLAALFMPRA